MTGDELTDIMRDNRLSIEAFARIVRFKNATTLREMMSGKREISGPLSLIAELIRDGRLDDLVAAEHKRREERLR